MKLESGTGNGSYAAVNGSHELLVRARVTNDTVAAARSEASLYIVTTDLIALTTTASYSGVFFLSNLSAASNIYIDKVFVMGDQAAKWRFYYSTTTGTLVTNAVPATARNTNLSSGNTLQANLYKGVDGDTITDGAMISPVLTPGYITGAFELGGGVILGTGDSIAISCRPTVAGEFSVSALVFQTEPDNA